MADKKNIVLSEPLPRHISSSMTSAKYKNNHFFVTLVRIMTLNIFLLLGPQLKETFLFMPMDCKKTWMKDFFQRIMFKLFKLKKKCCKILNFITFKLHISMIRYSGFILSLILFLFTHKQFCLTLTLNSNTNPDLEL